MTEDQIQAVLDRVRNWPRERQEDAAEMLMLIEEQDASPYQLTDGQAVEVERRRGDKSRELLTRVEFDERLRRFGA
jgi:anaerobic selenocysteine-containing dehydrogenase